MRSFIKLLVVLLICVAALGFWLGWFTFSGNSGPDTDGEKINVNVSVDKGKIKSDVQKAEDKVKEKIKVLEGKGKAAEEK